MFDTYQDIIEFTSRQNWNRSHEYETWNKKAQYSRVTIKASQFNREIQPRRTAQVQEWLHRNLKT